MAFLKKAEFSSKLFIIAALGNFILLFLLFSLLDLNLNSSRADSGKIPGSYQYNSGNIDPLITRVPGARDIITSPLVNNTDPSFGSDKAPVIITSFADYECGYCQKQEAVIKNIIEQYKNKIRLIWKDYPERGVTSGSFSAAVAGRCAQEQGQFWPFHDLLFASGDKLGRELFMALAEKLNLKKGLFSGCLEDKEVTQLVKDNILEAEALDIKGVPFIFVNNQEIMGEATSEDLKKIIEIELNKS